MAFNLPPAQYLMNQNSSNNRGSFDDVFSNGLKTGGNLPITSSGTQVSNSAGSRGIYFGLNSQTSTVAQDASANTKVMLTSVQFNAPNRIQVGTKAQRGVVARLTSGAGGTNYREFIIGGNDSPFASSQAGPVTICIDLSSDSNDSSGGTYDNSNATGWGFGTFKFNLAGGSSNLNFFQRVFLFDTGKGEPNLPAFTGAANFDDAVNLVFGSDYTTKIGAWCPKSGSAIFLPIPFSIGDGSTATTFDDSGAAIISPSDNALNQENFRLTNNAMRVYWNASGADVVTLSGGYSWGSAAPWDFNEAIGVCTLSGTFVGMGEFKIGSAVTANGSFNLASGAALVSEGADITGVSVAGNVNLVGGSVTSLDGVNIGGALSFDTAGTYTITNSTIEEVVNTSGGTVDILLGPNSSINTNTGPNINVLVPPSVLTLTGLQLNSEVRVYEAGTTNELAGVENSTTVFTASIDAPSVDIRIASLQYIYIKISAVDTSSDTTLPIQQQFDRNYENP